MHLKTKITILEEFCPTNEMSEDDEETIAKAEAEAVNVNEEVAALQRESTMDIDDFLKALPKNYLENRIKISLDSSLSSDNDEEFEANENSSDCEDTIKEQEGEEMDVDHKKELEELNVWIYFYQVDRTFIKFISKILQAENEMSLDDLLAKYKGLTRIDKEQMEIDSDDEELDDNEKCRSLLSHKNHPFNDLYFHS